MATGMHLDTELRLQVRALRGEWPAIAQHADVSLSWMSQFCRGKIPNPGIQTLRQLAVAIDALGLAKRAAEKHKATIKKPLARRAAVPEARPTDGSSDDAPRADDRQSPCGEVVVPDVPPPVASSATPDESNRQ